MIERENTSLKPIYLSYAVVDNGMKLENLILLFKEFKVVPSILSSANIIEIFENVVLKNCSTSCGVTRSGPGQITVSYQEVLFRRLINNRYTNTNLFNIIVSGYFAGSRSS